MKADLRGLFVACVLLAGCGSVHASVPASAGPAPAGPAAAPPTAVDYARPPVDRVPPELATPGVWVPVSGFESRTHLTRPVTIGMTGGPPDVPHPPGTPVDATVSVWNPDDAAAVHVTDLILAYRVERYTASGELVPVYTGHLPPLNGALPPRAGHAIRIRWDQRDEHGAQAPVGATYRLTVLPATFQVDGSTVHFEPYWPAWTGFTLTWPAADVPQGTFYGPWQSEVDGLRVTVAVVRFQPARTQVEMRVRLSAYRPDLVLTPAAFAITAGGEVPLLMTGKSGGAGDPLPGWHYPVEMSEKLDLTPLPPGTSALKLRWQTRNGATAIVAQEVPLAAQGPRPTGAQLAALERLAAAIDSAYAPKVPQWDRDGLAPARRTQATAADFLRWPVIGCAPGVGGGDDRYIFRRVAAAVLADHSVAGLTFVFPDRIMTLSRASLGTSDVAHMSDGELDQVTGE